jgi:hypothetical protein
VKGLRNKHKQKKKKENKDSQLPELNCHSSMHTDNAERYRSANACAAAFCCCGPS